MASEVLTTAKRLVAAGISCIPIVGDGTKGPALDSWDEYMRRLPTSEELDRWFRPGTKPRGIGIVGGEVSGCLGVLDVEYADYWELLTGLLEDEAPGLIDRLPVIKTPGKNEQGGRHVYFRTDCKVKTQKLAKLPNQIALEWNGDANRNTAIEIKAEGGYVLTPGCPPECHSSLML